MLNFLSGRRIMTNETSGPVAPQPVTPTTATSFPSSEGNSRTTWLAHQVKVSRSVPIPTILPRTSASVITTQQMEMRTLNTQASDSKLSDVIFDNCHCRNVSRARSSICPRDHPRENWFHVLSTEIDRTNGKQVLPTNLALCLVHRIGLSRPRCR